MAAARQTDANGAGRHRGQTAPHGGKEAKHPQVCPHSLRPGHGPPEPREGEPQLHSIQFYMKTQTLEHCSQVACKTKERWKPEFHNNLSEEVIESYGYFWFPF